MPMSTTPDNTPDNTEQPAEQSLLPGYEAALERGYEGKDAADLGKDQDERDMRPAPSASMEAIATTAQPQTDDDDVSTEAPPQRYRKTVSTDGTTTGQPPA